METYRNGEYRAEDIALSKLPLRDGNAAARRDRLLHVPAFETSSEGWKRGGLNLAASPEAPFETSSEGWKLRPTGRPDLDNVAFETSSEGWKPVLSRIMGHA